MVGKKFLTKWVLGFFLILFPFLSVILIKTDPEIHYLSGDWECSPGDFREDYYPEKQEKKIFSFPTNWLIAGMKEKAVWCRKTVYLTEEEVKVSHGIFFANIVNAYQVFWNKAEVGKRGVWTQEGEITKPDPSPYLCIIPRKYLVVGENNLAIRVLDSSYAGGVYNVPLFGKKDSIFKSTFLWFIKIGGYSLFFLFMGMYHFILYTQSRDEKYFLFFALICFFNGINVLAYYKILYYFYSDFHFNYFLFHFCFLVTVSSIPIFLSKLFEYKMDLYSKALTGFYFFDLFVFLITFFFDEYREFFRSYIFSFSFTFMNGLLSIELFRTIFKAKKSNIHGSHFYVLGSTVGGAVIFQSFLRFFFPEITEIYLLEGFMSFILSIALAISAKSRGGLVDIARIKAEYSVELEKKVDEKTRELGVLNQELLQSNTLKDKLFSILAHDLRTPMQSLQDLLYILENSNLSHSKMKKEMKKVSLSLFNNKFLLENLLRWISVQMRSEELEIVDVDIYRTLREMQIFYQPQASSKKVNIKLQMRKSCNCLADPNVLKMVLRNLLDNAIKYSKKGEVIYIGTEIKADFCEIYVQDFGMGIDIENMKSILKGKPVGSSAGTENEMGLGLGLHLCQEFLKKMNSQIFFDSHENQGTKFYFQIPLKKE